MEGKSFIQQLGLVVGPAAAFRLVAMFAGTTLKVPEELTDDHSFVRCIGPGPAAELVALYAGQSFVMPSDDEITYFQRVRRVAQFLRRGCSPREVGLLAGVSVKEVGGYRVEAERCGLIPLVFDGEAGRA